MRFPSAHNRAEPKSERGGFRELVDVTHGSYVLTPCDAQQVLLPQEAHDCDLVRGTEGREPGADERPEPVSLSHRRCSHNRRSAELTS